MTSEVHIGRDGWLFLSGGSNEVLKYYTEPRYFDAALKQWLKLLRARSLKAVQYGVDYAHVIVPDKISVYSEHYRDPLPLPAQAPTQALPKALAADSPTFRRCYVDLLLAFLARKESAQLLYYKTDSHWTFFGAYAAYEEICRRFDVSPHVEILEANSIAGKLSLDLGARLSPPVQEEYRTHLFFKSGARRYANCLVEYKEEIKQPDAAGLHVGSHVVFENAAAHADPRKIILFGDSYSEYRTHLLTGMLAETFSETHFVWSSNIDWAYVAKTQPDIVITEMAERFMNLVPNDSLNLEAFAKQRLREYKTANGVA